MFHAWFSRGRRLTESVICSQNPKRPGPPTTQRANDQRPAHHPVNSEKPITDIHLFLSLSFTLFLRHEFFSPPQRTYFSPFCLQFLTQADTPPDMRVRRRRLIASPWMRVDARQRRTGCSAACARSSPLSRSTGWRRSSASTSIWRRENE